ncbi:putative tellurium resistance membrane protein TerC [Orbus hercynius]|uniref:Putative tellurium resistance membrane protein TerC n=1 Tax=Orbus hercynius TaxID=593135 RepID=A0A495REK3_9GAMM|nr:TerC family protein [Orbus hercynius]RKS85912.1 putative tellurium resistance membrane protein TerC [Orbus hercynius]
MFEWIADPNAWLALTTLTFLEIILGIDNIIFLSLVVARLPKHQQNLGRKLGLGGAMIMRIALLASLAWVVRLSHPLFYIHQWQFLGSQADVSELIGVFAVSARDIVLFLGGAFLVWKGSLEIKEMLSVGHHESKSIKQLSFCKAIAEIMALDMVFSLDSVITAVGLSDHIFIMIAAVVIAVMLMMFAARAIGDFVEAHPTIKMLAIVFLVMVGLVLMIESLHIHVPKAYIYFAMFFSLAVEALNLWRAKKLKQAQK